MTAPLEIELKLEVAPEDRDRLAALAPFADDPGETAHLVSTYFDTPELDLHDAGYSLRIRRKGKRRIQTVKAGGEAAAGLFVRPEWERAVDGDQPILDEASGPLAQMIGEEKIGRLGPLFVADVQRMARTVSIAGSRIELAIDHGEVRAGDRRAPLCEIELELEGGSAQALFDLARTLDADVPLRLGVRTKSERGYDLVSGRSAKSVKAEPVRLDPGDDAGAAFQAIAHACIRQFRLNETLLLETGEADALHQARVGLRRLRSAFSLHKRLLAGDERLPRLKAELRWLAGELGEVRNVDVLIPRLGKAARRQLVEARVRMFEQVRAALMSPRARLLMIDLAEWLALGDWRMRPAEPEVLHRPATAFAGDVLDLHRKRLKRRGRELAKLDDEHRHRVRIEAKKLRYASEFFGALYVGHHRATRRNKAFLVALEALQDHLGELNDHATSVEILSRLGMEAALPRLDPRERRQLLGRAEDAYETLIDVKRFWR